MTQIINNLNLKNVSLKQMKSEVIVVNDTPQHLYEVNENNNDDF